VEAVILKALAKKPADRYQTGAELSAALEQALKTGGIGSPTGTGKPAPAGTILSRTLAVPLPDEARAALNQTGPNKPDLPPGPDADLLESWD